MTQRNKLNNIVSKIIYKILIPITVFLLIYSNCQNQDKSRDNILATVNGKNISVETFRTFYELDPNFGVDSVGYRTLKAELDKYIDHILAYQFMKRKDLVNDSLFVKLVNWEYRQTLLRQLYREVISAEIRISEEELKREYFYENTEVHVRHLFSKDSLEILNWYRQLQQGQSFQFLAPYSFRDTILANNGGDIGWVSLGELEENFAEVAEKLEKGEISTPFITTWGYHIIQLLDKKTNVFIKESDFDQKRKSLEKKVKRKMEKIQANRYISDFIGELNPQPDKNTFLKLWHAVVGEEQYKTTLSSPILFTDNIIQELSTKLSDHLQSPLITYKKRNITLGEYLTTLKKIPLAERPRFISLQELSNKLGQLIRDELLIEEAIRRNLHNHENVLQEVREIRERNSYYYLLKGELDEIIVPEEIQEYFNEDQAHKIDRSKNLSRFHTLQEWQWWQAEINLHKKLQEQNPTIHIDEKLLQEENARIDWRNRIRLFMIRKPS